MIGNQIGVRSLAFMVPMVVLGATAQARAEDDPRVGISGDAIAGFRFMSQSDSGRLFGCCEGDPWLAVGPQIAGRVGWGLSRYIRVTGDVSYAYLLPNHSVYGVKIQSLGVLFGCEYLDYTGLYGGGGFGLGILHGSGHDYLGEFSRVTLYDPLFVRLGIERLVDPTTSLGVEAAFGFPPVEGSLAFVARWM